MIDISHIITVHHKNNPTTTYTEENIKEKTPINQPLFSPVNMNVGFDDVIIPQEYNVPERTTRTSQRPEKE